MKGALSAVLLTASLLTPIDQLDHQVQRWVQDARRPGGERVMRAATDLGKPVIVASALVLVAVLDRARGWTVLRDAVVALVPTNLAVEGLKRATDRTRPDGSHSRSNASFPSSHAANAFAIAWVLARRWRRASGGLFVSAALVAFSRVYLNRHFMSDVVVGAALGMVCAWLATRLGPRRWPVRGDVVTRAPAGRSG
jgi:membrane-associated phospholipid phosphatase